MERVFLFDIDLTLIRTNGAGSVAMTEILHEMLGIADGFAGIEFGGRTDVSLLREALSRHDRLDGDFDRVLTNFKLLYFPRLAHHLRQRGGIVLPGVPELLTAVGALPGAHLGVATGNFRAAAEIKLRHFGLWEHFADGGYADDGEDRAELVAAAVRRMAARAPSAEAVYVFGDSPHDIMAAKANGAIAIGVATGGSDTEILAATGADFVFENLSNTEAVLRVLLGGKRSP